jgi:hypothetical protein
MFSCLKKVAGPAAAIAVLGAHYLAASRGVVGGGSTLKVGGVVGALGGAFGLFEVAGVLDLPLPFVSLPFLLTLLEIGHWCRFWALQETNLCPHSLQACCD